MFMTTCWLPMWLMRCQGRQNGELLPPWHPELNGVGLSPSLVTDRLDAPVGSSTWRIGHADRSPTTSTIFVVSEVVIGCLDIVWNGYQRLIAVSNGYVGLSRPRLPLVAHAESRHTKM